MSVKCVGVTVNKGQASSLHLNMNKGYTFIIFPLISKYSAWSLAEHEKAHNQLFTAWLAR